MKPPFTYFGGKTRIAPQIATLLPDHEHYVEPFAGSLAVLLAKRPSGMETVNDLDGELMNFWRILRDHTDDLLRVAALTPHSRAEHAAALDAAAAADDLERARRTWVRLSQGRGGHTQRRTGWRYYQDPRGSHASMPDYIDAYLERICPAARRLRSVSLECRPALEVIRQYGQHTGTLVYADPPYVGTTRTWGNNYAVEMRTDDEHRELADALDACKASVVLSGYHSPLYDALYRNWYRTEIPTETGNGGTDRKRVEVLWSNRPFAQASLFDGGVAS